MLALESPFRSRRLSTEQLMSEMSTPIPSEHGNNKKRQFEEDLPGPGVESRVQSPHHKRHKRGKSSTKPFAMNARPRHEAVPTATAKAATPRSTMSTATTATDAQPTLSTSKPIANTQRSAVPPAADKLSNASALRQKEKTEMEKTDMERAERRRKKDKGKERSKSARAATVPAEEETQLQDDATEQDDSILEGDLVSEGEEEEEEAQHRTAPFGSEQSESSDEEEDLSWPQPRRPRKADDWNKTSGKYPSHFPVFLFISGWCAGEGAGLGHGMPAAVSARDEPAQGPLRAWSLPAWLAQMTRNRWS